MYGIDLRATPIQILSLEREFYQRGNPSDLKTRDDHSFTARKSEEKREMITSKGCFDPETLLGPDLKTVTQPWKWKKPPNLCSCHAELPNSHPVGILFFTNHLIWFELQLETQPECSHKDPGVLTLDL